MNAEHKLDAALTEVNRLREENALLKAECELRGIEQEILLAKLAHRDSDYERGWRDAMAHSPEKA